MAANPFDQFDKPSANPFDQFDQKPAANPFDQFDRAERQATRPSLVRAEPVVPPAAPTVTAPEPFRTSAERFGAAAEVAAQAPGIASPEEMLTPLGEPAAKKPAAAKPVALPTDPSKLQEGILYKDRAGREYYWDASSKQLNKTLPAEKTAPKSGSVFDEVVPPKTEALPGENRFGMNPEFVKAVEAQLNALPESQRGAALNKLLARKDLYGRAAQDIQARYQQLGKLKTTALKRAFDPRIESQAAKLAIEGGMDPEAAQAWAAKELRLGRMPSILPQAVPDRAAELAQEEAARVQQEMEGAGFLDRVGAEMGTRMRQSSLGAAQIYADISGDKELDQRLRGLRQVEEARGEAIPKGDTIFERSAQQAIATLATTAPMKVLGAMTGFAAPVLSQMAFETFTTAYGQSRSAFKDPMEASIRAGLMTTAEVLFERFGLGDQFKAIRGVVNGIPTKELSGYLSKAFMKEVPAELATTTSNFITDLAPQIGLNQNAGLKDYFEQAGETIRQTVIQGGASIGAVRGAAAAEQAYSTQLLPAISPERAVARAIRQGAEQAEPTPAALRALSVTGGLKSEPPQIPVATRQAEPPAEPPPTAPPQEPAGRIEPTIGEWKEPAPSGQRVEPKLGAAGPRIPGMPTGEEIEEGVTNVTPEGEQATEPVVGFTTERGSTYALSEDGQTSRTKRSEGRGQGKTYEPHMALYVAPGDHLSILGDMQGGIGSVRLGYINADNNTFVPVQNRNEIPAGSQAVAGVFNRNTNEVIGMYRAQIAPAIGLHPVEKLYKSDGTASTHVGNKIVKLETRKPEQAKPQETQQPQAPFFTPRGVGPQFKGSVAPTPAAARLPDTPTVAPATQPKVFEPAAPQHQDLELPSVEVPLSQLKLSKDVPQFKYGASKTGVVKPLGGKFSREGLAPIAVWERLDGSLEIISGRHRFDLAQRSGEKTIPSQIYRERDGFTAVDAAIKDAELNIRDDQGQVKDYVNYFKESGMDRETAESKGLLARDKGKRGFTIGNQGSDELIEALRADKVSDTEAYYIALNAPNDSRLQAVGIKAIMDGKSANVATNMMQAVKALASENDTTLDMFGFDDSAIKEAEEMAKIAQKKQREVSDRLSAISGAAKRPEIAKAEGIDIKDPEAVKRRIDELRNLKAAWDNWSTNPELIAQIREARGVEAPKPFGLTAQTPEELEAQDRARKEQEAKQKAEEEERERKAKADEEVGEFVLTGSDREADEAAARGQEDLFAAPPKTEEKKPEVKVNPLQAAYDKAKAALDALGPEPTKPSSEKKFFGARGKAGASPELVKQYEEQVKRHAAWKRKYTPLKKKEVEAANALFRSKEESGADKPNEESSGFRGASDAEVKNVADAFGDQYDPARYSEEYDGDLRGLFSAPTKNEVVRAEDKVRVYVKDVGYMTVAQAKARIEEWKKHTQQQGETTANSDKVVLSLFDLTGQWSAPWEEAGYQVYRFDIQEDPEFGDVKKFDTQFFMDTFSMFEGNDVYAILAACPCTDFASSGSKHFAAKDADGRTLESVDLVRSTLATIEYFKPAIWAIENPVGRIEKLTGLPPWRMSFNPNHFGDPYTKKTLLWGRFNADLPVAPVEPTEGSKMHRLYGGKSQETKNARSVTPEGFAYAFFMANNAIDNPVMAVSNKYAPVDPRALRAALDAGMTEGDISSYIDDAFYDKDYTGAAEILQERIDELRSLKAPDLDVPENVKADDDVRQIPLPNGMLVRVFKTSDGYGTGLYDVDSGNYVDGSIIRYKGIDDSDALDKANKRADDLVKQATPVEPGKDVESESAAIDKTVQDQLKKMADDFMVGDLVRMGNMPGVVVGVDGDYVRFRPDSAKSPKAYQRIAKKSLTFVARPDMSGDVAYSREQDNKFGEEAGQLNANMGNLIQLLGANMYASALSDVSIKELLQNAFDAVKGATASVNSAGKKITPLYKSGNIEISIDNGKRTISFKDDARGMTPEIVRQAFFTVAGSDKSDLPPSMRSGGLGLAKMGFMLGSKRLQLDTVRDGVRVTVDTTAQDIANSKFVIKKSPAPKDEHGTTVTVTIPEKYTDPKTGDEKTIYFPYSAEYIDPLQKPLIGPVTVKVNMTSFGSTETIELPVGTKFPEDKYSKFKANFEWGSADIYFSIERNTGGTYSIKHQVLSSGVYQFSPSFAIDNEKIPYDIIVDVKPNVDARHPDYPFENSRERFKGRLEEDIKSLTSYLGQIARGYEASDLQQSFKDIVSMPRLEAGKDLAGITDKLKKSFDKRAVEKPAELKPLPKEVTITADAVTDTETKKVLVDIKAKEEEKKKESSFKGDKIPTGTDFMIDMKQNPSLPIFHNNTNVDFLEIGRQYGEPEKFFAELGTLLVEMKEELAKSNMYGYGVLAPDKLFFAGISIDKGYGGIHIKVPYKAVMVNPFYDFGAKTLFGVREQLLDTMIHEIAHTGSMDHGVAHNTQMLKVKQYLADEGLYDYYRDAIMEVLARHESTFTAMRDAYGQSTTRNTAKSLEDYGKGTAAASSRGDRGVGEYPTGAVPSGEGPQRGEDLRRAEAAGEPSEVDRGPREVGRVTDTPEFKAFFRQSKVVDDNGEPMVMYHGTTRGGFTVFDRLKTLEWRGPSMDTVGSWFSNNPSDSGGAGMYAGGGESVIYPVYLSIQNPKVYRTFNDFLRDMHRAAGRPFPENAPGRGSAEELRAELKAQGYDGIELEQTDNESLKKDIEEMADAVQRAKKEEFSVPRGERQAYTQKRERLEKTLKSMRKELDEFGSGTEFDKQRVFIAFEPEQIKSVFNRGTFDRRRKSIMFSMEEPSLAEQEGDLLFTSPEIREEKIKQYAKLRASVTRMTKQIAEGKASIDLQRNLTQTMQAIRELQAEIKETVPRSDSPEDFYAKALKEYSAGNISEEVLDVIKAMYQRHPEFLNGLLLSVTQGKNGFTTGSFVPWTRIVRLYKSTSGVRSPQTIRHEIGHSLEQLMTDAQRKVVIQAWGKALQRAIKQNPDDKHQEFFNAVNNFLSNPTERSLKEAIKLLPSYSMYQYVSPSEFWAVNSEKLMAAELGTAWDRFKSGVRRLFEALKKVLGFDNRSDVHNVFRQIMTGDITNRRQATLVDVFGDKKFELQNIQDEKDLLDRYARPNTPKLDNTPIRTFVIDQFKNGKDLIKEASTNPTGLVSDQATNVVDGLIAARTKAIWYGAGLESRDFDQYKGQLRTGEGAVIASVALDNAIRSGNIGVEVLFRGGIEYNPKQGNYVAVERDLGMRGVYEAEAKLKKKLGDQVGTDIIQAYLEAKRSISIMNEFRDRTEALENAKKNLDALKQMGAMPDDIKQAQAEVDDLTAEVDSISKAKSSVNMSEDEMYEFAARDQVHPELADIMKNWSAINQNLLRMWRQVGLLSQGRYETLSKIKDYVPWYRITSDDEDLHAPPQTAIQSTTRSMTNIGREKLFKRGKPVSVMDFRAKAGQKDFKIEPSSVVRVKVNDKPIDPALVKATASGEVRVDMNLKDNDLVTFETNREIQNIIDNMTRNVMRMTMNGIRQFAANRIVLEYATRNTENKIKLYSSVDRAKGRFNWVVNGRKVVVEIQDPLVASSIYGMDNLNLKMWAPLAAVANLVRRTVTLSPDFQISQVLKDAPTAAMVTGVRNPIALIGGVLKGFTTALVQPAIKKAGADVEPVIDVLKAAGIGGFHSPARTPEAEIKRRLGIMNRNVFSAMIKALDHIGDSSDMAQRVAVYKRVLAETGDETQALFQAANVINFLHHGSSGTAQAIVKVVPFMGAYANSIDVLMNALIGGGLKGMSRKRALARLASTTTMLMTVTILYCMLVGGDPEYDELDDQTKLRNVIVPGTKIAVPMNTSASLFWKAIPELIYNKVTREGTENEYDARRLRRALSQIARDSLLGPEPVPAGLKPILEVGINYSFFTGRSVIPEGMKGVEAAEQYVASTSELGKKISELLEIPGTDGRRVLSPIEADHIMRGIFGTAATIGQWVTNRIAADAGTRPELTERETPMLGKFMRPDLPRGREDLYYDLKEEVERKYKTYMKKAERDSDDADKYLDKNEGLIAMHEYITEADENLQEINAEIRRLATTHEKISAKDRRKEITELEKLKQDVFEPVKELRREVFK